MSNRRLDDSILRQQPCHGAEKRPPALLTAKETQVLLWSFQGKTSWEIARIQNCTEATINFHFSNIRRKFEVGSRSAAVLKAIELGIISMGPINRDAHEHD
jgi:LuxR family quorum-sensing transcriptional regulator LasR